MDIDVGSAIRKYREKRGYTLEDLARKVSLSASYLSEIERGKKRPSLRAVDRLCSALNLPKGAIFPDDHEGSGLRLGDKIRALRAEKKLTLKTLAERVGVSHTYLSEIERGTIDPAADTLKDIARELGVPVSVLMAHSDNRLGRKLRELRNAMGLTQAELASRAGISPALVGQVEAGKTRPSLKTIERIAESLGVSPCYLIVENDHLREMLAAMGPDLRALLLDPKVQAVLRLICNLNEKELKFVLNFIELYKRSEA